jgi:3-oxoacyl-[acyl-carrier protein] reductase
MPLRLFCIVNLKNQTNFHHTRRTVLAFTRSVAVEVVGGNIFVNAIAAGGILTPPMEAFLADQSEEGRNALHQIIPLGRLGKRKEYSSLAPLIGLRRLRGVQ